MKHETPFNNYLLENIKLYHGDCLQVMKDIPDESVDMILCDLPYGTTACKWDVVIPFAPLWEQYWRITTPTAAIVLFGSEPFSSHLRLSSPKEYRYDWIWNKVKPTGFQIVKHKPMQKHECISVFYRKAGSYQPQKVKKDKPRHTGRRSHPKDKSLPLLDKYQDGSIVEWSYPQTILEYSNADQTNKLHPTQKPVPLIEYLIKTYTNEGETLLYNCMCSGSTGVACINTKRKFIGIEKDNNYFDIALTRILENLKHND